MLSEMFFLGFFYRTAEPAEGGGGYFGGREGGAIRNWPSDVALMAFFFRCRQQLLGQASSVSCAHSPPVVRIDSDTGHFVEAFRQSWHFRSFVGAENSGHWNFRCAEPLPVACDCIPHAPFEVVADHTETGALAYLTVVLPLCTREIRIVDHEPLLCRPAPVDEGQPAMRGLERVAADADACGVQPLFVQGRFA